MLRKTFLIFFAFHLFVLHGQIDSTYIESVRHLFSLKLDINTDQLEGDNTITTVTGEERNLVIKPNEEYRTRITASYRFLTVAYSFVPSFVGANDDNHEKGDTDSFKIGLNIATNNYFQRFFYHHSKGFYLDNTDDFVNLLSTDTEGYIKLSEMEISQLSSESYYYLNGKKHSIRLDNNQQEIQRLSSGSLIIPFIFIYEHLDAISETPELITISSQIPDHQKNINVATGIGYSYHYVPFKNWFITARAIPLVGYQWSRLHYNNDSPSLKNQFWFGGIQNEFAIGYNSRTFFGGAKGKINYLKNSANNVESILKESTFQVYFGYRFKAPKFMKNTFDTIENIFIKK